MGHFYYEYSKESTDMVEKKVSFYSFIIFKFPSKKLLRKFAKIYAFIV
jgi:hypothetical protein